MTLAELAGAQTPWQALAERSENIFSTWEWAHVWWRHFGPGRSLSIRVLDDRAGRLTALLPLATERRKGLRLTRFIGHGVADQLGPVCDPADASDGVNALTQVGAGDILILERMAAERAALPLAGHVLREEAMPTIDLAAATDWESYVSSLSVKLRRDIRRRARRLERLGVRFRLTVDRSTLDHDMDAVMALHAARWDSASQAFGGPRAKFHREFAQLALERGWLRLWLAELDGAPVAASYGFRFGEADYGYQNGRDPAWEREGVGAGLQEHAIRQAIADGVREFRLLRGDEGYKLRYATEVRRVLTIALPRSQKGRGAVALARSMARTGRGRSMLRRAV